MKIEMSKTKTLLFLIALILTNFAVMGDMVIYVITNNLYEAFPNNMQIVNFIISGPSILVVIGSLIAPLALKKISKRDLIIIAGIVFGVSAIFTAAIQNPYYIALMRSLTGLAIPFIHVSAMALIAEVYADEKKRAGIVGLYNTILPLVGSAITLVTGFLAVKSWQNSFNIYWVAVPMVFLAALFIPNIKPSKERSEEKITDKKSEKKPFGSPFWIIIIQCMFIMLSSMMLVYFQAVYIAEHSLGNETFVGLVHTVVSFGSVLISSVFGVIFAKLKRKTIYISYIFMIISCLLLYFVPNRIVIFIAYFIAMMAYGNAFSYIYAYPPTLVNSSRIDTAIGFGTASYGLAGFLATYAVTTAMGILKTQLFTPVIVVIIVVNIILVGIEVLIPKNMKESPTLNE